MFYYLGLHWSNSTCTVLTGNVTRHSDDINRIAKETFTIGFSNIFKLIHLFVLGQNFRHGQIESYIYELGAGTHVACYGRGFVPASYVWTFTGGVSNGDPLAIIKLTYVYARSIYDNIAYKTSTLFHHYKEKASKFEL